MNKPAVMRASGIPARVWPRLAVRLADSICVACSSEHNKETNNSTPRAVSVTWSQSPITRARTMIWKAAWAWCSCFGDVRNSSNELNSRPPAFLMAYCWVVLLYAKVARAMPAFRRTSWSGSFSKCMMSTTRNFVCSDRIFCVVVLFRAIFPIQMAVSTWIVKHISNKLSTLQIKVSNDTARIH